ncbi:3165_t:CDS:2, partial [Acaulospora colombiana]
SMLLVHMLKEYTPHLMGMGWELHISRQENVRGQKQKNGLWALHCRAALLWNACHKLRQRPDWEFRRTELLGKAWIEATCIEIELAKRTGPMRQVALNAGREYIFQYVEEYLDIIHYLTYPKSQAIDFQSIH